MSSSLGLCMGDTIITDTGYPAHKFQSVGVLRNIISLELEEC